MDFKKTFVTLDEIEAPEILYKYRDWEKPLHQDILLQQQVYFSPPSEFEDKKDCKSMKRYDLLNDAQIYDKYRKYSNKWNPHFSPDEHAHFATEQVQMAPFKNPKYLKETQDRHWLEYNDRMGILCLTANPTNSAMWDKYANGGKGFCVGFDSKELFKLKIGAAPVHYPEELPTIFADDHPELEEWKQVFNKEKQWNFEEEYRITKFYRLPARDSDRLIKLPKFAIKRVVVGSLMSRTDISNIVKNCKDLKLTVSFFKYDSVKKKLIQLN